MDSRTLPHYDAPSDREAAARATAPLGAPMSGRNSASDSRPTLPLQTVGPYSLDRRLGSGGMADVYAGRRDPEGPEVAIKVMRPLRAGRRATLSCFDNESAVMAALHHPHVVPLLERGMDESGLLYLVMPVLEGRSLRQHISEVRHLAPDLRDRATCNRLLPMFAQLCDAVEHAHSRGIIHRDLKPSNTLIGARDRLTLLDWGVAAPLGDPSRIQTWVPAPAPERTLRPRHGGTPGYMSPEQIYLHPSAQGPQSDIWSLGALLFELAAWTRLVPGVTTQEILTNTVQGRYAQPGSLTPLGELLRSVALHAAHPVAGRRIDSVGELRARVLTIAGRCALFAA